MAGIPDGNEYQEVRLRCTQINTGRNSTGEKKTDSGQGLHGQSCDTRTEKSTIQSFDIADCINEICPWSGESVLFNDNQFDVQRQFV